MLQDLLRENQLQRCLLLDDLLTYNVFSEQFQMFSTRLSPTSPSPWNCSISPLASAALSESAPGNCVEDRFLLSISAQRFSLTFDIPQLFSTASLARSTAQKLGQSSPFRRTHDSPYSISSRDLFFQGRQIRCVAANKGIDPLLATLSRNLPVDLWPRLQHLVYVRMFMYVYVSLYKSCMCEGGKLFEVTAKKWDIWEVFPSEGSVFLLHVRTKKCCSYLLDIIRIYIYISGSKTKNPKH